MKQFLILISIVTFLSCSKDTKVNIRMKNVSEYRFDSTSYNGVEFGTINPDEVTAYQSFESSYPYGTFCLIIDGQIIKRMPIDFVGEQLLECGDYTFRLNYEQNEFTHRLVKE
ncbi:MAG: hypothetical protein IPL23_13835 [Saprospiraceae bacterium]|nr:hypothetical protein [Saprospiraceae bacterium]MBK8633962.1 hypothetical protein [Saprospiraceae bacterium]MBP7642591.1 hypothetical protein [Saprospiraceae bacterium]